MKELERPHCEWCLVRMGISEKRICVHRKTYHVNCYKKHFQDEMRKRGLQVGETKNVYAPQMDDAEGR